MKLNMMTKRERIQAALNKQEVDRIPVSIWHHMPEVDQDPVELADRSIRIAHTFNYDFIKMMPFGFYGCQDYGVSIKFHCTPTETAKPRKYAIDTPEEWLQIEPLPAYYGTYGKQVEFTQQLNKQLKGEDIPYIQTIFSPLTTCKKIAGERVFDDMRKYPEYLHQALRAVTETTINFVKANIDAGVSGFFFATQCSSYDCCTLEEYQEFGTFYDLQVLKSFVEQTWFKVAHIHGDHTIFEHIAQYPVNCINWHDRWVSPSLAEARKITDKCLLGGLHEKWFIEATPEEIPGHLREAVESAGRTGLMIGPGCVAKLNTPLINFYAARVAIDTL